MNLNEYQEKAMATCMPSSENFAYMMLNLVGEVGEFASKVAKGVRKGEMSIGNLEEDVINHLYIGGEPAIALNSTEPASAELMKEAGDILWQLSGLCFVMGWTLEEVAEMNLEKLASRKERGVIDGSGDNR